MTFSLAEIEEQIRHTFPNRECVVNEVDGGIAVWIQFPESSRPDGENYVGYWQPRPIDESLLKLMIWGLKEAASLETGLFLYDLYPFWMLTTPKYNQKLHLTAAQQSMLEKTTNG